MNLHRISKLLRAVLSLFPCDALYVRMFKDSSDVIWSAGNYGCIAITESQVSHSNIRLSFSILFPFPEWF